MATSTPHIIEMSAEDKQNWQELADSLQVSQNELFDFQQSHFSAGAIDSFSSDFVHLPDKQEANEYSGGEDDDEDDDGLGYYEDGVKRTLTDEQIEIFRHSELRELRRKQERAKSLKPTRADEEVGEESETSTPAQSAAPPTTRNSKKKKKKGKNTRQEPKPDLRKRTWDVVDAGLDSLDYD